MGRALQTASGYPRLLGLAAGLTFPLAFAPFGAWWYAPVVVALGAALWPALTPRQAAGAGFAFGAGAFLTGTYWLYISITIFGGAPPALSIFLMLGLVLVMAVYYAGTAWVVARLARGDARHLLWLLPAAWVTMEWLRGWLLSGFPWLSLGYSQTDGPLAGFVPVGGVYGGGLAVALVAAALIVLVREPRWRLPAAVIVLAVPAAGAGLGRIDWTGPAGEPLRAALVQGAITQDRKWLPEERAPTLALYRRLTLAEADADIIVWPEVAVPAETSQVAGYLAGIDRIMEARDASLLLGIMDYDEDLGGYSNSVLLLGPGEGIYRKRHLVPFGEYFPVPDFLREWMRLMSLPYTDTVAGPEQPELLEAAGERVALTICYEDAFGAEQLYAFPEATLLVNVSNDAWFGDSIAPHQHLQIARLRSLEAGRWQLRATNTGITAFIDPRGRIHALSPQFETAVLRARVQPRTGLTPYAATGNWPVVGICLALLAAGALAARRRR